MTGGEGREWKGRRWRGREGGGREGKGKKMYVSVRQIRVNNEDEDHVVVSKVGAGWENCSTGSDETEMKPGK